VLSIVPTFVLCVKFFLAILVNGIHSHFVLDRDMGARHRARPGSIQIMKVEVIPASKLKSKNLRQFVVSIAGVYKKCSVLFPLNYLICFCDSLSSI